MSKRKCEEEASEAGPSNTTSNKKPKRSSDPDYIIEDLDDTPKLKSLLELAEKSKKIVVCVDSNIIIGEPMKLQQLEKTCINGMLPLFLIPFIVHDELDRKHKRESNEEIKGAKPKKKPNEKRTKKVSLQYKIFLFPTHLCGGAILNEYWILTAAHCVYQRSKRRFSVVVGLHRQDETNLRSFAVNQIIIHKKFVFETFLNDIALVRVTQPIALNERVNGICLPNPVNIASGIATAAGWGAIAEEGEASTVIMAVNLPIVPEIICEDLFGADFYSTSAMICAGYPEGGRDTCQGDSGGPLVQQVNGSFTVIGIVSFGVGCARPQSPGVYTKMTNYVSWINVNAK